MSTKINLIGKKFGRLLVLEEVPIRTKQGSIKWACKCDCGNKREVLGTNLKKGYTKSCGCLSKEVASDTHTTHGLCNHPLYHVWGSIKDRCTNPKNKAYSYYGGRGITVCDRWLESFENFYEDVNLLWKKGLQVDRIDNDKGYSKGNCRLTTHSQNQRNKRGYGISKYKGVVWHKESNKWRSIIVKGHKLQHLGLFYHEKDAATTYNKTALEIFGKDAYLNVIED